MEKLTEEDLAILEELRKVVQRLNKQAEARPKEVPDVGQDLELERVTSILMGKSDASNPLPVSHEKKGKWL